MYKEKSKTKIIIIILSGIILFFGIKLILWNGIFVCPFHSVTGLSCPGCGGMRSIRHLINGDILDAARCNILVPVFILMSVPLVFTTFYLVNRNKENPVYNSSIKYLIPVLVLLLVFTVLRNIPLYPFTLLIQ